MTRLASWTLLATAGLVFTSSASAQQVSVGGSPFVEAWVDPCSGDDSLGRVGSKDLPFRTIGSAMSAVSFHTTPAPSAANPGLVHANPGVYDSENYPLSIPRFVSLQGTGAKQCVLRGNGTGAMQVFWPIPDPEGSCDCGLPNQTKRVLIDFVTQGFETENDSFEEMVDGFTFQGGDVQVLAHSEGFVRARVSNCVFDMLDGSDIGVAGPTFGILMGSRWDYNPPAFVGYHPCIMNVLNNTFIQGWAARVGSGDVPSVIHTARADSVAICDVVDPACAFGPNGDSNTQLRGESNANIQNNLIRSLVGQSRTALLGIDNSDTRVALGTPTGRTNAFEQTLVGPHDVTGTFCVQFKAALGTPMPKVNPNPTFVTGADPAFVGEMLTNSMGHPISVGRDWRLLPDSILVDKGSQPAAGTTGSPPVAAMILRAANGTEYVEPVTSPFNFMPMSSFDFDGEVYGNPRVRGTTTDIGCDETQTLIDAGFGNDTILHGTAGCNGHCSDTSGMSNSDLIFPGPGVYKLERTTSSSPFPMPFLSTFPGPSGFYWAYSTLFGTIVPPSPAIPVPNATYWMQTTSSGFVTYSIVTTPMTVNAVTGYFPPFDSTHAHSFGHAILTPDADQPCRYVNQQGQFTPTGGPRVITNLQSSYAN